MLIILEGADFSANNVGTITIPRDSLDPTTELILSKMTKTITDTQKYAFDDLIIGLKNSGLWAKVVHMFVPFFANSVSEALYNAKLDIPVSGITNAASAVFTGYLLDQYGLRHQPWVSGTSLSISSLRYAGHSLASNSMFMAAVLRQPTSSGTTYYLANVGTNWMQAISGGTTFGILLGTSANGINNRVAKGSSTFGYASFVGNIKNPGNVVADTYVKSDGNSSTSSALNGSYSNPAATTDTISVAGGSFDNYFRNELNSVAIQIFGNELTNSEVDTLDGLLSTFHSKI